MGLSSSPTTDTIIETAEEYQSEFERIVDNIGYDTKGIFNSELLLFCTMCEYHDIERIIESGRARGHSTKVMSKFFEGSGKFIYSIDRRKDSEDDKIAKDKLGGTSNIELKYGDSREFVPGFVNKNSAVLIDGPKGDNALQFAMELLENTNVCFVAVHDLHKNTPHRDWSELLFNYKFFSDNEKYVKKFKFLDESCWTELDNQWEPYVRKGEQIQSYASTLGVFFNGDQPVDKLRKENYYKYLDWNRTTPTDIIKDGIAETLKKTHLWWAYKKL